MVGFSPLKDLLRLGISDEPLYLEARDKPSASIAIDRKSIIKLNE